MEGAGYTWVAFTLGTIFGATVVRPLVGCLRSKLSCLRRGQPVVLKEEPMKMILLIRNDLQMSKGKVAAQCAHAAVSAVQTAGRKAHQCLQQWEQDGQAKVTLKVDSEAELLDLIKQARQAGLVAESIKDAGRTQLIPGTRTVGVVGPAPARLVDLITGHLKLY